MLHGKVVAQEPDAAASPTALKSAFLSTAPCSPTMSPVLHFIAVKCHRANGQTAPLTTRCRRHVCVHRSTSYKHKSNCLTACPAGRCSCSSVAALQMPSSTSLTATNAGYAAAATHISPQVDTAAGSSPCPPGLGPNGAPPQT